MSALKIAIFGNKSQKTGFDSLAAIMQELDQCSSISLMIQRRYFDFLQRTIAYQGADVEIFDTYCGEADLCLSIGGDGSFLTTAAAVGAYETPIMGVNSGHLGYLAAAELRDAKSLVDTICRADYEISPRAVLAVTTQPQAQLVRSMALNEVAILKQDTASMIEIDTWLNGAELAVYRADGLIVSTPTGSTGYNLSVGGPVMEPMADNWIISPIAPHSLNMRPLVVGNQSTVQATVASRSGTFLLSVDGKSTPLPAGTTINLERALYDVNIVIPRGHNFIDTLRRKLLWGIDGL